MPNHAFVNPTRAVLHKMTQADFELIAHVLYECKPAVAPFGTVGQYATAVRMNLWLAIVRAFIEALTRTNDHFNRAKFLALCDCEEINDNGTKDS